MLEVFHKEKAEAVYCLDDTIDDCGKQIKNRISLLNRIPTQKEIKKINLSERLKYGRSPGLCIAFTKQNIPLVRKIALNYDLPHDLPVGLICATSDKFFLLNKVLVHHRIHYKNVSNPEIGIIQSAGDFNKQIKSRKIKINEIKAVLELFSDKLDTEKIKELEDALHVHNLVLDGLKVKNCKKVFFSMFVSNKSINKLLILRNYISLICHK